MVAGRSAGFASVVRIDAPVGVTSSTRTPVLTTGKPRSSASVPFFFQAEDGIRDTSVTGVQTCALPISQVFPADTYTHWLRRATPRSGPSLLLQAYGAHARGHLASAGKTCVRCRTGISSPTPPGPAPRGKAKRPWRLGGPDFAARWRGGGLTAATRRLLLAQRASPCTPAA